MWKTCDCREWDGDDQEENFYVDYVDNDWHEDARYNNIDDNRRSNDPALWGHGGIHYGDKWVEPDPYGQVEDETQPPLEPEHECTLWRLIQRDHTTCSDCNNVLP